MTYIPDLAPVSYSGFKGPIRAVGWLDSSHPFRRGSVDPDLGRRLMALVERPVRGLSSRGMHWCSLCSAEGKVGPDCRSSQNVLLVPAPNYVYETPIWIGHYVLGHSYQPPDEFWRAVELCPEPGSDEFRCDLVAHLPELSRPPEETLPFFTETAGAQWTLQPSAEYGSEDPFLDERQGPTQIIEIKGPDLVVGIPKVVVASSEEIAEALVEPIHVASGDLRAYLKYVWRRA